MLFGGRRTSSNVERGERAGGFGFGGGGGMGGAGAGMLLSLVFSRFGIGGVVVLLLIMFLFSGNPFGGGGQQAVSPQEAARSGESAEQICAENSTVQFSCQVLASTEEHWGQIFTQAGSRYEVPRMVVYNRDVEGACGVGQSAMGPFYCPLDHRIYLDPVFFRELEQRHGASGDFAQAYVVAHEVGHHVQTINGTADRIRQAQSRMSRREANALQVRMELQADCYAGVWAARERAAMEPGDFEEGMTAAAAIGDDTLQQAGQGHVVPESFTHGTSAQRQEALRRGYQSGDPAACESYTAGI
jgi:predicted metalloprotease